MKKKIVGAYKTIVCSLFCLMLGNPQIFADVIYDGDIEVASLEQVNEDFYEFEKKFVSDAKFQMSRIVFDNLGYKLDDDPESEGTKYSPKNWTLFKKTFDDVRKMGQFKTKMELTTDKCVQKIWIEDSSFLLEYTYTRINGKWYLTKVFERN